MIKTINTFYSHGYDFALQKWSFDWGSNYHYPAIKIPPANWVRYIKTRSLLYFSSGRLLFQFDSSLLKSSAWRINNNFICDPVFAPPAKFRGQTRFWEIFATFRWITVRWMGKKRCSVSESGSLKKHIMYNIDTLKFDNPNVGCFWLCRDMYCSLY